MFAAGRDREMALRHGQKLLVHLAGGLRSGGVGNRPIGQRARLPSQDSVLSALSLLWLHSQAATLS